jgi:hypothetical protein
MHPAETVGWPSLGHRTLQGSIADDSALLEEYLREEVLQFLESTGT